MRPQIYKHDNCTDVAMQVVKSYFIPQKDGWKLKVIWLNIVNPKNVFKLHTSPVKEFIKREDIKHWGVYDAGI